MATPKSNVFPSMAAWCVVGFFVAKAALTGLWVVRPWDVPDEVGHFSYIRDIATGKGLPVLHESLIDDEIWPAFAPSTSPSPGENWIAQHPPLYHVLMVPAYFLGGLMGDSFWGSFYLIRIFTAVLFGVGLWVMMKGFAEIGLKPGVTIGLGIMLACIPNHTFLAAAVNHDALVFLFGSLVLLFWIRFYKTNFTRDLLLLGMALGLSGLIKYTCLVLFPPLVLWVLFRRVFHKVGSWGSVIGFLLCCGLPISLWMLRNLLALGEFLPVDTSGFQSDEPLSISLLEFGRTFPVFSILLQSFWGLLGWMGDLTMQVRWLQMYSIYQKAFTWPLLPLLVLSLYYLGKQACSQRGLWGVGTGGVILGILCLHLSGWSKSEFSHYQVFFFLLVSTAGWIVAEGAWKTFRKSEAEPGIEFVCLLLCGFFLLIHLLSIYKFSVSAGTLQGTFGRYYLPVVGFAIVSLLGPGLKSFKLSSIVALSIAILYGCVELYVWLHEAIPFFRVYE